MENSNDALKEYISFGGLPYLIHLDFSEPVAYEYLKNAYATVLFKDVVTNTASKENRSTINR